ncbi:nucleoside/nucleotide kinase family protein [Williamsia sterculiae]|uniref:Panthothenate kinase n=1 Tax=Williamsia sterculiae TaxID=1344003 RepID=A0A1N7CE16_9NOCA|nr:nucleoside/nucleotide kinase family protein [Williamsia sterculiae]SIR61891.1 Panthothenate kinase [Williamsia sterculiae]
MTGHPPPGPPTTMDIGQLVDRAHDLSSTGERRLLGITGSPGAGKSTLCAALRTALDGRVAVVGMDGFHLSDDELRRLGRRERKGAPDTFDVGGYIALLRRLRGQSDDVVYAPEFDRSSEISIGSSVPVPQSAPLVVTEGNYLLYDAFGWAEVAGLLDETWFLDVAPVDRRERLMTRRRSYGDTTEQAGDWVMRVDEVNAALVEDTRHRADLIVRIASEPGGRGGTGSGVAGRSA